MSNTPGFTEEFTTTKIRRRLYERRYNIIMVTCEHSDNNPIGDSKCTHDRNDVKICRFSACPYYQFNTNNNKKGDL